jgi:hypothetical protein
MNKKLHTYRFPVYFDLETKTIYADLANMFLRKRKNCSVCVCVCVCVILFYGVLKGVVMHIMDFKVILGSVFLLVNNKMPFWNILFI